MTAQAATTWHVTDASDNAAAPVAGSLRDIVQNHALSGDTVEIDVPAIVMTEDLFLPAGITIDGQGTTTISRTNTVDPSFEQFYIQPAAPGQVYVFKNLEIVGAPANDGSAIYAGGPIAAVSITLDKVDINNESAADGAGLFVEALTGFLQVTGSSFASNHADFDGGSVNIRGIGAGVPVTFTDTSIVNSTANGTGGGLFVDNAGAVTITDATGISRVSNNTANNSAGIHVQNADSVTVTNTVLDNNDATAGAGGAGLATINGTVKFTNSDITNSGGGSGPGGGALLNGVTGLVTFSGDNFDSDTAGAADSGGALYLVDLNAGFSISGSIFNADLAGLVGGAIEADDVIVDSAISGSTFTGNRAGSGGAIYFGNVSPSATLTVSGNTFDGNLAQGLGALAGVDGGGAIQVGFVYGVLTASSNTFTNNVAQSNEAGGAILLSEIVSTGSATISQSTFETNAAFYGGGAIMVSDDEGSLSINGSTFHDNTLNGQLGADFSGLALGVPIVNGTVDIVNTTILESLPLIHYAVDLGAAPGALTVRHSTISGPGGINIDSIESAGSSVSNTIVEALDPGTDPLAALTATGLNKVSVAYSILSSAVDATFFASGSGVQVGVDPLLGALANNGGTTRTRLPANGSPAINLGDPAVVGAPAVDQRGAARIVGGRVDIGAVETSALVRVIAATGQDFPFANLYLGLFGVFAGLAMIGVDRRRWAATTN